MVSGFGAETGEGATRTAVIIDYHMHLERDSYSARCRFNEARIREYVDQARACGVHEIGISEHCNRFAEFRPLMSHLLRVGTETSDAMVWHERSFREDLASYFEMLLAAKAAGLPVKASLEVDYLPGYETEIRNIIAAYPFDYVLGSVHFLGIWGIDMDAEYGWPDADIDQVYQEYFETLTAAARSGLFDILAHPDLVKKFGHRPSFPLDELYDEFARSVKAADVAIEINTAGLHKPVAELYPAMPLLGRFKAHGVPLTLASDAHEPGHVGRDFDQALRAAHEAGFRDVAVFDGRRRSSATLF